MKRGVIVQSTCTAFKHHRMTVFLFIFILLLLGKQTIEFFLLFLFNKQFVLQVGFYSHLQARPVLGQNK